MKFKTWLEGVEHRFSHEPDTMKMMIQEAPHTRFTGMVPPALAFLKGEYVDLGFENLDVPQAEKSAVYKAFSGPGVRVPGTNFRLRTAGPFEGSVVEAADGSEPATLPDHWKQAVAVLAHGNTFSFIGKRVRPEQVGSPDMAQYKDDGDGFVLNVG